MPQIKLFLEKVDAFTVSREPTSLLCVVRQQEVATSAVDLANA